MHSSNHQLLPAGLTLLTPRCGLQGLQLAPLLLAVPQVRLVHTTVKSRKGRGVGFLHGRTATPLLIQARPCAHELRVETKPTRKQMPTGGSSHLQRQLSSRDSAKLSSLKARALSRPAQAHGSWHGASKDYCWQWVGNLASRTPARHWCARLLKRLDYYTPQARTAPVMRQGVDPAWMPFERNQEGDCCCGKSCQCTDWCAFYASVQAGCDH